MFQIMIIKRLKFAPYHHREVLSYSLATSRASIRAIGRNGLAELQEVASYGASCTSSGRAIQ
jgi:hypothetical protein